jgi:hypothetical protein
VKLKIEVTQEDIDKGKRDDCTSCPIALAAIRTGATSAFVDSDSIHIVAENERGLFFKLPLKAQQFIHDFDYSRPVSPFSFVLGDRNALPF